MHGVPDTELKLNTDYFDGEKREKKEKKEQK